MESSMREIRYAEDVVGEFTLHRRPVPKRGVLQLAPGQGADGYGRKITTDVCLKIKCEKKERRVYCCCFSNSGTNYIVYKGETLYLRTHFQDEVLDD
jgi:hypothetical protein